MASIAFHGIEKRADGTLKPKIIVIAAAASFQQVTLDAGSVFYVHKITKGGFGEAATLEVIDHDGRAMFDAPIETMHIAGPADRPYILPIEWEWQGGKQPIRVKLLEAAGPL